MPAQKLNYKIIILAVATCFFTAVVFFGGEYLKTPAGMTACVLAIPMLCPLAIFSNWQRRIFSILLNLVAIVVTVVSLSILDLFLNGFSGVH